MTRRALCVGLNYPGTSAELRGCVNDALDWKAALEERWSSNYDIVSVLEPTKAELLSELAELVRGARWGDRLVFTYSGHGTFIPDRDGDEPDRRDEALVSVDMRTITDDEIHNVVGRIPRGARLTIISDSCHSGTMTRFMRDVPVSLVSPEDRPRFLDPSQVTVDSAPGKTRGALAKAMLLSGCKDDEVSYDAYIGGRYRGAMTAAALDALPHARNMRDWQRRTLAAIQHPQTPQLTATPYQRYGIRPFA